MAFAVPLGYQPGQGLTDDFGFRVTEGGFRLPVPADDVAAAVGGHDGIVGRLRHSLVAGGAFAQDMLDQFAFLDLLQQAEVGRVQRCGAFLYALVEILDGLLEQHLLAVDGALGAGDEYILQRIQQGQQAEHRGDDDSAGLAELRGQVGDVAVDLEYRDDALLLVADRQIGREDVKVVARAFEGIEAVPVRQPADDLSVAGGEKCRIVALVLAGLGRVAGKNRDPVQGIDLDLDHLGVLHLPRHQGVKAVPVSHGAQGMRRGVRAGGHEAGKLRPQRVGEGVGQRQVAVLGQVLEVAQGQVLIAPAQQYRDDDGAHQAGDREMAGQRILPGQRDTLTLLAHACIPPPHVSAVRPTTEKRHAAARDGPEKDP